MSDRETKMAKKCIRCEEVVDRYNNTVWHVSRGPSFVGAFSTKAQADEVIDVMLARAEGR